MFGNVFFVDLEKSFFDFFFCVIFLAHGNANHFITFRISNNSISFEISNDKPFHFKTNSTTNPFSFKKSTNLKTK